MKKLLMIAGTLMALGTATASPSQADTATTTTTTWYVPTMNELRSGPDVTFPVVANIPAEGHMAIHGCLQNWSWCDVTWNGQRGWLKGSSIQTVYQSRPVYVPDVGPGMNVPVVTYDTANYWDTYYKTAPFYTQRQQYVTWVYRP